MTIAPRTEDDVLILDLVGDVTIQSRRQLRETLMNAVSQGQRTLALSFSLVPTMDSSGLATLVEIVQRAEQQDVRIGFFALCQRVRAVMQITNLHRIFPIYEDEASTLAALRA